MSMPFESLAPFVASAMKQNLRIAAVVNEYGSVDHDGSVVEHDGLTDTVGKLAGGCICCQGSLGDELEDKVGELLRKPDHAEERYDTERSRLHAWRYIFFTLSQWILKTSPRNYCKNGISPL